MLEMGFQQFVSTLMQWVVVIPETEDRPEEMVGTAEVVVVVVVIIVDHDDDVWRLYRLGGLIALYHLKLPIGYYYCAKKWSIKVIALIYPVRISELIGCHIT